MSGHSKWKNIMHRKGKSDAERAKIFTKIGREISVTVKEGGADPTSNSKLSELIAKAKTNNVPNENIDRIIKKAAGDGDKNEYITIFYEGYGPCGVAVIVETLTDNRNRTAGEVRHYFDKFGGNLGQIGSVGWMFAEKGVIVIDKNNINEDKFMEDCLEAGAVDFNSDEDVFEVFTEPFELSSVRTALEKKNYAFLSAQDERIPGNYIHLDKEDDITLMRRLLDALEDNDDVQNVWHNWDEPVEED
jgi:YebC/PmpR family DNA-binding regulatory protein